MKGDAAEFIERLKGIGANVPTDLNTRDASSSSTIPLSGSGAGNNPPPEPPLNNGNDGGRFPGMEARIASLEAHMQNAQASLKKLEDLPERVTRLEVKVDHLPTKDYLAEQFRHQLVKFGGVVSAVGLIIGLIFRALGK